MHMNQSNAPFSSSSLWRSTVNVTHAFVNLMLSCSTCFCCWIFHAPPSTTQWGVGSAMPKARHCDLTCQPHVVKVCVCSASCLSEGRRTKTYATVIAQQNSQIQKPACDSVPWFRFGYQESVDIVCWCSVDTSENVPVTMFGLLLVWRLEAMSVIIFASYIVFKLYC